MAGERSKIYHIPDNFASGPRIWQGMVSLRNFVEGIIMAIAGVAVVLLLPLGISNKIGTCIVVGLPLVLLGVAGINGDPVSQFLLNVYRWATNRRIMLYNINTRSYSMPILEMMLTMERPVDTITDLWASIKTRLGLDKAKEEDILIEGRDFVFDKELEDVYAESKRVPTYVHDANSDNSMINFDD